MIGFCMTLSRRLHAFACAKAGNVAMTFGLATLPVIGGVGAAVDYSHAHAVKAAMQAALDSTALMISRDAATTTSTDLQTKASNYFNALFTRPEATNVTVNATYTTTGGSQVLVSASARVPTSIMGIVGYNYIDLTTSATARWGVTRLRVALALDVTGSMASAGKLDALKSATKALLTQLKNAATVDGDVYVSIVPFVKDVNVGASNYNGNWIYWGTAAQDATLSDNSSWDANNGTCSRGSSFNDRGSCVAAPACSKSWYTTASQCTNNNGTWYSTAGTWTVKNHNTWNGCITDRGNSGSPSTSDYDRNITAPSTSIQASLFPAEQYSNCPAQMVGLSYDWTSLNSLVDSFNAAGNTNQPIGLVWAWQSLVGGGPLTAPAKSSSYNYSEIIILMSDGLNTQDRWYGSQSSIDKRMYDSSSSGIGTCKNIKDTGVTIYTVHVNTNGDPLSTLLRNCATDTDKFWMITSAGDLSTVFNKIGTEITKLRVAQ